MGISKRREREAASSLECWLMLNPDAEPYAADLGFLYAWLGIGQQ